MAKNMQMIRIHPDLCKVLDETKRKFGLASRVEASGMVADILKNGGVLDKVTTKPKKQWLDWEIRF